jgi:hypothetical protein
MAGFWETVGGIGGGVASAGMGISMAQKLGQTGEDAAMQMGQLAGQLKDDTAFKGYGVTTGLGTSTVNADGSTDYGVGQDAGLQGAANSSLAASQQAQQNAMQDYTQREQDIYNRAMAMQNPMLDAQQAAQQANEFAMGRGGVRGSQFGGTAEDAAMARARAQASNQASFQAMGQAQQEMMNQGQLSSMFGQQAGSQYGQSFTPLQMQMAAMQGAQGNAGMAQSGQFTGAGYGAQLGLGAMQSQINAEKAASELYGNMFNSIANNASGWGENLDTAGGFSGLWNSIFSG